AHVDGWITYVFTSNLIVRTLVTKPAPAATRAHNETTAKTTPERIENNMLASKLPRKSHQKLRPSRPKEKTPATPTTFRISITTADRAVNGILARKTYPTTMTRARAT